MSPSLLGGDRSRRLRSSVLAAALGVVAALITALPASGHQKVVGTVRPTAGLGVAPSGAVSSSDGHALDVTRVRRGDTMVTTVVSH